MPPEAITNELESLLNWLSRKESRSELRFADVLEIIDDHYNFTPTAFDNGQGADRIRNTSDENQGACRVFAFGRLHDLGESETLTCFGEHYRRVLDHPDGADHGNIRQFMASGWSGIRFYGQPLSRRTAPATQ